MFSFRKPSHAELNELLWKLHDSPFTYAEVEGTRSAGPKGFSIGHQRVCLGQGREVYLEAKDSIRTWKMFPGEFVDLIWPGPIEVGRVVATVFHAPGFWTVNACRIAYTIDDVVQQDDATIERFGFAYGTVGSHMAAGEERFTVEHDHSDDSVWYEVYCFSRASHWLARAAYPYLRLQQHRFRRLSAKAMQDAVTANEASSAPDTVA